MATKKKHKKAMAKAVSAMPVMTTLTQEEHYVKGTELIEQGHYEDPDGNKIDPEKMYRQMMPVIIARNHEKGFMKAFAQGGREGVTNYIKRMRQKVEKATAQNY